MDKRIYLCLAHMSGNEQKYIQEAFDTNWVVPLGPNVIAFENSLEEYINENEDENRRLVVALSSGTAAIHMALVALGIGPGDEVMVQSFTFCASANPVIYCGATPVFVDSERDTWNMDPELLDEAIADRIAKTGKTPKAIIPVTLYGMPYKIEEIMAVANKYGIPVIEDSAEGLGSRYKGQMLGTFGRFGVMSFNGNKMITTSGGGALICPDEEAKKRVMYFATQARQPALHYHHTEIGYNYRMSNICAGIGRGQMTVLEDHIRHHQHVHDLYVELLANVPGVKVMRTPKNENENRNGKVFESNYWLSTILLDGIDPEVLCKVLDNKGIESRPLWKPMHMQPVFEDCPAYENGVSESLFKAGLCLPSGPMVTDEDVHYIVECIKEAIKTE